ncbi:hypothetical protein BS47DRAFT_734954 [Hydnum rufescens UP504]|uniref:Uncharacterized protein n=1 Tax=Hydnum rufescens UP504 TaxID=1448309 RepID=A0A9P6AE40_9AGAM|nr:hypothetical protein BS47DRAFT_734954 [Hydnum rufescens UP504]
MMPNPTPALDRPLKGSHSLMDRRRCTMELWRARELLVTWQEARSRRSTSPPSSFNSQRPREDSNTHTQAISDDSSGYKPMEDSVLVYPSSHSWGKWQARSPTWAMEPAPYKHYLSDSAAFGIRDSRSNGGQTHPPGDGSRGGWYSSPEFVSNTSRAPARRTPRRLASSTWTHTPEDYNPSDDIHDAKNTCGEQWDPSPGLGRSWPAYDYHPFVGLVKPPRRLSGEPDDIGGVRDPSLGLHDQHTPTLLPSVHHPLGTINPLALSNSMGGSNARTWPSLHYKGRDVPNFFLSKDKQVPPDFAVPDVTREIHNKTLVAKWRIFLSVPC